MSEAAQDPASTSHHSVFMLRPSERKNFFATAAKSKRLAQDSRKLLEESRRMIEKSRQQGKAKKPKQAK
jgi:hypothetical protein